MSLPVRRSAFIRFAAGYVMGVVYLARPPELGASRPGGFTFERVRSMPDSPPQVP